MTWFEDIKNIIENTEEINITELVNDFLKQRKYSFYTTMNYKFKILKYIKDTNSNKIFSMSDKDIEKYHQMKSDKVSNKGTFTVNEIDLSILNDLVKTPKSDKDYSKKIVVYLQYVSGRRIGEIYDGFTLKDDKLWVRPLKKGLNTELETFNLLPKISVSKFLELYDSVKFWMYTYKDVVSFTKTMNRFIQRLLGDQFSTHKLRGIYSQLKTLDSVGSKSINIQNALNHSNTNSVKYYDNIKVKPLTKDKVICHPCKKVISKKYLEKHQATKKHLKHLK